MHTIHLPSGIELAYERSGTADRPPLLLIHGMGENHAEVEVLADRFAPMFDVVRPDLPGHGASPMCPTPVSVEGLAEVMIEFCGQLGLRGLPLVGHSLGAAITTSMSAIDPGLVSRLVLLDPGMLMTDELVATLTAFYAAIDEASFETCLREVIPPIMFRADDDPVVTERIIETMRRLGADAFTAYGAAVVGFDAVPAVAAITAPTLLVITGQPLLGPDALAGLAESWLMERFDGLSHQGLVQSPAVAEAAHAFVSGVEAAPERTGDQISATMDR